jgi:hypothetical protein
VLVGDGKKIQGRVSVFQTVLGIRIRRIPMFLGLPDPDPLFRGSDPGSVSFPFLIKMFSGLKNNACKIKLKHKI